MTETHSDTYDFIINEDDEIMLLLYAGDATPQNPHLDLNIDDNQAILYRSEDNGIIFNDITDEIMDILEESDTLLICELSKEEHDEDTKIINAYEAIINH